MNRTILQIPMSQNLKINAEKAASDQGFSSLQELVRVFLAKLASRKIEVALQETIILSEENEKRYLDMTTDFRLGRSIGSAKNVDDLMQKLHENSVS